MQLDDSVRVQGGWSAFLCGSTRKSAPPRLTVHPSAFPSWSWPTRVAGGQYKAGG